MSSPRWHRNHRPLDRVHDVDRGFGRLLLPWRGGWFGWREASDGRSSLVVRDGEYVHEPRRGGFAIFRRFHNCTASGIR